jgi:cytochrome c553
MKKVLIATIATVLASASIFVTAGDVDAGKAKAATCAACHGMTGISPMDLWPNLAGQKKGYLVKQMTAFRDGTRNDPSMSPMAAPLSDADIENLAEYYSSLGK